MPTQRHTRAYTAAPNTIIAGDVNLYYRDWGRGRPALFVSGWSMCSDSWGYQMMALCRHGLRCIAFDRRALQFLPLTIAHEGVELNLFTTITTLGTPHDVTVHELRLESFFPADKATADWFRGKFGA